MRELRTAESVEATKPRPLVVVDGRRLTAHSTGVGRYLTTLLNCWAEAADRLPFEPLVILREDRPNGPDRWKSAFGHMVTGSRKPGWIWENMDLARRGLRHATLFAPANLVPWRWAGPVVLVVHDTFCEHADARIPTMAKLRFRGRYRRSARRADLILTPSGSTSDDVRRHFGIERQRIRIIRPGVACGLDRIDLSVPGESSPLAEGEPFVLFVGKTSRRRDFASVIKAVESLVAKGSRLRLVRVGPEPAGRFRSPVLTDLGHVPDDELSALYRRARALVWPSTREGFGLPVLEAMAHGCPVITTPVNALAELGQGACFGLAESGPESIETAIRTLLDDEDLRSGLIRAGIERSKAFDDRAFATEVARAISSVACHSSSHHLEGTMGRNADLGQRAVRIQH